MSDRESVTPQIRASLKKKKLLVSAAVPRLLHPRDLDDVAGRSGALSDAVNPLPAGSVRERRLAVRVNDDSLESGDRLRGLESDDV
mgnify:CR=1 FL=1